MQSDEDGIVQMQSDEDGEKWNSSKKSKESRPEQNDTNPEIAEAQCSQNGILFPAKNGEEIVNMLQESEDVHPIRTNKWGQTPLLQGLRNWYKRTAKRLWKKDSWRI